MLGRNALQFERFRGYLCVLASMGLDRQVAHKLDASDIVQQTLLHAHEARSQFRGTTDAECIAWLRQILANNLAHCVRDLHRDKRDVRREHSLDQRLERSSWCLLGILGVDDTSPLSKLEKDEQRLRIMDLLSQMEPHQRDVLWLKYWHDLTLAEIAMQLQISTPAAAGILYRGLKQLRQHFDSQLSSSDPSAASEGIR